MVVAKDGGHDHAQHHLQQYYHHHMVVTANMFTMVRAPRLMCFELPQPFLQAPEGQSAYSWNKKDPPQPLLPRRPILSRGCNLHVFKIEMCLEAPHFRSRRPNPGNSPFRRVVVDGHQSGGLANLWQNWDRLGARSCR